MSEQLPWLLLGGLRRGSTAPTRPALSYCGSSLAFQVPHVPPPLLHFSIFSPLGTLTLQQPRPGAQTWGQILAATQPILLQHDEMLLSAGGLGQG